ncbi:MAG: cysteinyl-tRNA synthetase [Gaiellales bacterium]|nr:cysteinyl-tRNA synthetase [Gaiellales bacterium]
MRIRDSLSGELRELEPGGDGRIGIYVCGPTVYNRIHVGNARPFVVFLLMKRYLEWRGQPVTLVENITDINDKIYAPARAAGIPSDRFAAQMAEAYIADTDLLGIGRPDREPRATETLAEILALIEQLIASGHAYEAGGDVYFAVRSFDGYGKLSNQRLDQLVESARGEGEPGEHKRDPLDFALWKANKPDEDTWWDSPWGRGRPGWHIECSAMAERWLGPEFALHGGGRDLIFPHHENEIAQSQAGGRPFARIWAHNGMLRLGGEKMSKSLGNIDPLHSAIEEWGREAFLLYLLGGHYAAPIDYSDKVLEQARATVETLRNRLRDGGGGSDPALIAAVCEALDDDFNTPRALALLFDAPAEASGSVAEVLEVLGLGSLAVDDQAPPELDEKRRQRDQARQDGDFARADALRTEIEAAGWEVRDTGGGTVLYPRHG